MPHMSYSNIIPCLKSNINDINMHIYKQQTIIIKISVKIIIRTELKYVDIKITIKMWYSSKIKNINIKNS